MIATGSKPRPLPIPGAELMITSDEMLSERDLPASVIFVGGGVISLEFGHVYARTGAEVTILEALPQLLPAMDADAVARLQTESERIGISVKTAVSVRRIEHANGRLRVVFSHDGAEHALEADRSSTARAVSPMSIRSDLAAGNVEHANGRVAVDRHLRSTSNPHVHVCGDAVPTSPQLSPIATYEGDIVGRNIVEGPKYSPDYASMATSVYTVPALAAVGLTEAAARQKGFAIDVHTNDMHDWFSARTYAETVRGRRSSSIEATDRILGAHFVGHAGPGTGQYVRPRNALWPHGARRSATTSTPIRRFPPTSSTCSAMHEPRHSAALSNPEPTGISFAGDFPEGGDVAGQIIRGQGNVTRQKQRRPQMFKSSNNPARSGKASRLPASSLASVASASPLLPANARPTR